MGEERQRRAFRRAKRGVSPRRAVCLPTGRHTVTDEGLAATKCESTEERRGEEERKRRRARSRRNAKGVVEAYDAPNELNLFSRNPCGLTNEGE